MHFTPSVATAILLFCSAAIAAPVPQIAGEGSAANSILSNIDNGIGFGVENAEDNTATLISKIKDQNNAKRQIAGEGSAADSILSNIDNGVGFGVENAEDNTANLINDIESSTDSSDNGANAGGNGNPPPPPPPAKRQLNKISNGLKTLGDAAGIGFETTPIGDAGDSIDQGLTNAAADVGTQVGNIEENTGEDAGNAVPKQRRQLNKISNGLQTLGSAAGIGFETTPVGDAGDSIDQGLTNAAADVGTQAGNIEENTGEDVGNAVPRM